MSTILNRTTIAAVHIANKPITDNPALERYRQLLLACAEGKEAVPLDHQLAEICEAAGRSVGIFKATLERARFRFQESEIDNQRRGNANLIKTADPRLAKRIAELKEQMDGVNRSSQEMHAKIRQAPALAAKGRRWREEAMALMTGGVVRPDRGHWPDWLKGQTGIVGKVAITLADVDPDLIEETIAGLERAEDEIPALEEACAEHSRTMHQLQAKIDALRAKQLDPWHLIF